MPAPVCLTELEKIYGAIMALQTGSTVTSISFGERQVSYTNADTKALMSLYRTFWQQCGRDAGYPDLSAARAVERGAPARYELF